VNEKGTFMVNASLIFVVNPCLTGMVNPALIFVVKDELTAFGGGASPAH
jgi:hypothetical protein